MLCVTFQSKIWRQGLPQRLRLVAIPKDPQFLGAVEVRLALFWITLHSPPHAQNVQIHAAGKPNENWVIKGLHMHIL